MILIPKITDKQFLEKEPYKSILHLLIYCGELSFKQIFHALKEPPYDEKIIEQLKNKSSVSLYEPSQLLIKRTIKLKQRLMENLNLLMQRGYIAVEGEKGKRTYRITEKTIQLIREPQVESSKKYLHQTIDTWKPEEYLIYKNKPLPLNLDFEGIKLRKGDYEFTLAGIPLEVIRNLSDDEKQKLTQWLNGIIKNLNNIMQLKKNKTKLQKNNTDNNILIFLEFI